MKSPLLVASLALVSWLSFPGCTTSPEVTATAELAAYKCPMCKETVTWSYTGATPSKLHVDRKKVKVVTHECPSCRKSWGANLSIETVCDECQKQHLECPMCKKHG